MTTLLGLITGLSLSLAAWTDWTAFSVLSVMFGVATVVSWLAWLLRRRDREPRGAHSAR